MYALALSSYLPPLMLKHDNRRPQDAMKAFKAHFGRLPQNRDVLEPEGNYDEWQGQVYLKLQLRGAPRVSPGAAPASPVLYDFSATGVGWPEILEDVEKIHLTVM